MVIYAGEGCPFTFKETVKVEIVEGYAKPAELEEAYGKILEFIDHYLGHSARHAGLVAEAKEDWNCND